MKPLIVIAGPTACGKTDTSIQLAKKIDGEIISADSMQIYKYMDIGTAKPTSEEMQGVKHYLIDELYPDDEYSVYQFQKLAKEYIHEIYAKDKTPILVGGTGFYINALLTDNCFDESTDMTIRKELFELAEQNGNEVLHNKLKEIDECSAEKIHFNNVKRVVRAIEYFRLTGEKFSEHNLSQKQKEIVYDAKIIILNAERQELYARINQRVDTMVQKGLVEEVNALLERGYDPSLVSMQGLGYKEIVKYLHNQLAKDEAIDELKAGTRHFAKRQLTWFKNQLKGLWINIDEKNNSSIIVDRVLQHSICNKV